MERYNLFIRRYSRNRYFETLEELKAELKSYLTTKEVAAGVLDMLTTFDERKRTEGEYGYIENHWKDFTTRFY